MDALEVGVAKLAEREARGLRTADAPSARALSTYSSSRMASVLACTTRVKRGT